LHKKRRVSVTMPELYIDAMKQLVADGIYLSRGEIILEAIRDLLKRKGIPPFTEGEEKATTPEASEAEPRA